MVRQGYRCHLGSVPAAIGLAQLQRLEEFIGTARPIAAATTPPSRLDGIQLFDTDWKDVAPYIYVIRVRDPGRRDDLIEHLKRRGIATGVHFLGAHEFSFYSGCRRGTCR